MAVSTCLINRSVSSKMYWPLQFSFNICREFLGKFVQNSVPFEQLYVLCIDCVVWCLQDAVAIQLEDERLVKIREVLKDLPALHHRSTPQTKTITVIYSLMSFSVKLKRQKSFKKHSGVFCQWRRTWCNNPRASFEREHASDFTGLDFQCIET